MKWVFPQNSIAENKYYRWYLQLCKQNSNERIVEKHHIVPVSFGGANDAFNLVRLTPRQHFIAHLLLLKFCTGIYKRKAAFAISFFLTGCKNHSRSRPNSRTYAFIRSQLSEAFSNRKISDSTRKKISDIHKGKTISENQKLKISESMLIKRPIFVLSENKYTLENDFYRYCKEHRIGRSQVQAGLKSARVHVIKAGKHKGKCFSWSDIGAIEMQQVREESLAISKAKYSKSAERQWKTSHKNSANSVKIKLMSPDGQIIEFDSMLEAGNFSGIPWTTLQSCKTFPWTFKHGAGKGWSLIDRRHTH